MSLHRANFLALVPPPGRLTVEVGCREVRVTRDLQTAGHRVVGIDSTPLEDGAADLAVAFMSLMAVDDLPAVARELGRVVAPGGRLVAGVAHPVSTAGAFQEDGRLRIDTYFDRRHLILEDYSRALEPAGFLFERFREIYDEEHENWSRVPLFLDFTAVRA